jgi:glycerophosphoryl diester phosphodiesterase
MRWPLLIAHSGFADTPPNSLASVEAAREAGADGVEFDVQCSAEGIPILAHDSVVVSPRGLERPISSLPSTAIAEGGFMVPGAAEAPPSLLEVIDRCREVGLLLNLDVKDLRALVAIRQLVLKAGSKRETFLTGCTVEELSIAGRSAPELSILVNVETQDDLDAVVCLGGQGINLEHSLASPQIIEAARRRFLSVGVWTVDEPDALQRVAQLGVDSVTSNRPTRIGSERAF